MSTLTFTVNDSYIGLTIRQFLQDYNVGKAVIYKYSSNHLFEVNYKAVNSEYRFKKGDVLSILIELYNMEIVSDIEIDIIYEDDDIVVVNKQFNLIVHDDGASEDNLTDRVNHHFQRNDYHHLVLPAHRIDKETSGIVVFAKHFVSLAYLSNLFETRQVIKNYICVVENKVKEPKGSIESKLIKDAKLQKMVVSNQGKLAITHYELIQFEATRSRLKVSIETGRTHQIRAHLASINHPVVGDILYGVKSSRLLLHFSEIAFPMIRTKKVEHYVSNPPF
jgi:23S rRNA pseudouridine1911/1915/1917 synthase